MMLARAVVGMSGGFGLRRRHRRRCGRRGAGRVFGADRYWCVRPARGVGCAGSARPAGGTWDIGRVRSARRIIGQFVVPLFQDRIVSRSGLAIELSPVFRVLMI
jgi:hypothetical protein